MGFISTSNLVLISSVAVQQSPLQREYRVVCTKVNHVIEGIIRAGDHNSRKIFEYYFFVGLGHNGRN